MEIVFSMANWPLQQGYASYHRGRIVKKWFEDLKSQNCPDATPIKHGRQKNFLVPDTTAHMQVSSGVNALMSQGCSASKGWTNTILGSWSH